MTESPAHPIDHAVTGTWRPPHPIDPAQVLWPLRRGSHDPTLRFEPSGIWRTSRTPQGSVTLHLSVTRPEIRYAAWGPGAEWAVAQLPELLGAGDDWSDLDTTGHPVLDRSRRAHPGLRIPRTTLVFESLVPAVLEQRVVGADARRSWRELVTRFGSPAPGPAPAGVRRSSARCGPCRASGCGPPRRSCNGRTVTRTPSASATTTCPRSSDGR